MADCTALAETSHIKFVSFNHYTMTYCYLDQRRIVVFTSTNNLHWELASANIVLIELTHTSASGRLCRIFDEHGMSTKRRGSYIQYKLIEMVKDNRLLLSISSYWWSREEVTRLIGRLKIGLVILWLDYDQKKKTAGNSVKINCFRLLSHFTCCVSFYINTSGLIALIWYF